MIYRASIEGTYEDGTEIVNVLHYRTIPGDFESEPAADDVAGGIWETIGEAYLHCLDPGLTVHQVVVVQEEAGTGIPRSGVFVVEAAGLNAQAGGALPQGMSMILRKITGVALRSARGWIELPFKPCHDNVSGDNWSGIALDHAQDLCDTLNQPFTLGEAFTTPVKPCVWSRTRYIASADPTFFDITSVTKRAKVHWLRSRTTSP